jgi:hypothetical protein
MPKVFWIDQICINQEGDEKSHQVTMMGHIYKKALRVIIYIGPASTSEAEEIRGIELLMRLYEHYSDVYEIVAQANSLYDTILRKKEFPVIELPKDLEGANEETERQRSYEDQGWRWLLQVAYGEWTRRLWIVQEQMLCRDIAMLRGPQLISWDAVMAMPILFHLELLPGSHLIRFWKETYSSSLMPRKVPRSMFYRWRQKRKCGAPQISNLVENMAWHEDLECQDPRDRIFALLGISADPARLNITPDYSKGSSTSSTFLDASIRILHASSNLGMLIHACRWAKPEPSLEDTPQYPNSKTILMLPSWALYPPHHPTPAYFVSDAYTPHPTRSYKIPYINPRSPILALKGCFIDRISMATTTTFFSQPSSPSVFDGPWIRIELEILSNWLEVLYHLGISLESGAHLCRVIIVSPSWNPTDYTEDSIMSTAFHLWSYYRYTVNEIRKHAHLLAANMTAIIERCNHFLLDFAPLLSRIVNLSSFRPDALCSLEEYTAYKHLRRHILTNGRSYCATDNGHACNAINQAREGDVVAALQGSDRLWILRLVNYRYRLIGETYVDGLMSGEAYKGVDPNDVDHGTELI